MWSPDILIIVTATFLLAGFVKGVVGLGLPTVALGLLTATLGLKEAMALMLIPSFATNLWQGVVGGAFTELLRRLWTLLAVACVAIWIGAGLLARADAALLSGILGFTICLYATVSLATPQIPAPGRRERWLSPLVGAINGGLTGITGSFVVPGVAYLQALGLPRDQFVQAMGILFTVSTVALGVALSGHRLLPLELGALSGASLLPAAIGMVIGQRIRQRLSEQRFRQVFFSALIVLGVYIVVRAFF